MASHLLRDCGLAAHRWQAPFAIGSASRQRSSPLRCSRNGALHSGAEAAPEIVDCKPGHQGRGSTLHWRFGDMQLRGAALLAPFRGIWWLLIARRRGASRALHAAGCMGA
eukprot:349593-Chlamydomonas_euryale.AAC.3